MKPTAESSGIDSSENENSRDVLRRLLDFDEEASKDIKGWVAGVDEAGRGPLAGPVVAAAVILLRKHPPFLGLNDSKKVRPRMRENLYREISCHSAVGIGIADEKAIDEFNIYEATRYAMKEAVLSLGLSPEMVLIDGRMKLDLPVAQRGIIRGDQKSACIASASIVAKVCRDAVMHHFDRLYPEYHFKVHKGYATPLHLKCLREEGPSPIHRRSFAPLRQWLEEGL